MTANQTDIYCCLKQTNLRYLLDRARGAVGRMHPYFLLNIYLTRITCSATDLQVSIISEINVTENETIGMGGRICIPAKQLWAIIDALPNGPIHLQGLDDNSRLEITAGTYSGVIPCVDPDEHFPSITMPESEIPDFTAPGGFLNDLYTACHHALKKDEAAIISGLHLRMENGRLTAAATDGHRLAIAGNDIRFDDDATLPATGITIASKALAEIKKINSGHSDVWITTSQLTIAQPGITLLARLLDGDYVDFRRIVPTDYLNCAVINGKQLIEIIERVNILSETDGITIKIRAHEILIEGKNTAGTITDKMDCETTGEEIDIIFTPRYLLEALTVLAGTSEDIIVKYGDSMSPAVLIPADHSNWTERLEIIVPRRS